MKSILQILKANKVSFGYGLTVLIMPLVASTGLLLYLVAHHEWMAEFNAYQWMLFFLATALTITLGLTPTTLICTIGGFFMGFYCLPFVVISYMLSIWISFQIATRLDRGKFRKSIMTLTNAQKVLLKVANQQWQAVFFAKLSPALPFAFSNYLLVISGVSLPPFMGGSLLGMLPRTLLFVWVGTQLGELTFTDLTMGGSSIWLKLSVIVFMIIGISGLIHIFVGNKEGNDS